MSRETLPATTVLCIPLRGSVAKMSVTANAGLDSADLMVGFAASASLELSRTLQEMGAANLARLERIKTQQQRASVHCAPQDPRLPLQALHLRYARASLVSQGAGLRVWHALWASTRG